MGSRYGDFPLESSKECEASMICPWEIENPVELALVVIVVFFVRLMCVAAEFVLGQDTYACIMVGRAWSWSRDFEYVFDRVLFEDGLTLMRLGNEVELVMFRLVCFGLDGRVLGVVFDVGLGFGCVELECL